MNHRYSVIVVSLLLLLAVVVSAFAKGLVVTLKNDYNETMSLHWTNHHGTGDYLFDMEPGEETAMKTTVGHEFYATAVGDSTKNSTKVMSFSRRKYSFGGIDDDDGDDDDNDEYGDDNAGKGQCDAETGVCTAEADAKIIPKGANERGEPIKVKAGECFDRHEVCSKYHSQGECEANPGWMTVNCPVSCNACHLLDPKVRCNRARLNMSDVPIYSPGDLNRMFSGIKGKFDERYGVTVLSEKPWVVTFDNFLTDAEVNALIDTVEGSWERSTDTGSANEFGEVGRVLSSGRTSSNAWCRHRCESHPDVQRVQQKIAEVTGIPTGHSESFQGKLSDLSHTLFPHPNCSHPTFSPLLPALFLVLKYDLGQKYNAHMDYSGFTQGDRTCGPRILTFFLYLSDVEEGGETAFPLLNLAVKPKKGKAVLWPSVKDDNLVQHEPLSLHEARPVVKGRKYAANSWIHLYDYNISNLHGCTGTFDVL